MAISERQLQTWSHQGAKEQSAATYQTIRSALEDERAPYASRTYEVFLQGSYGNDTNVYRESDVDIVICLSSVYYHDVSELTEQEATAFHADWRAANYTFNQYKADVTNWLKQCFGDGVRAGSKAISVPGNESRRDADVLACVEHQRYTSYRSSWDRSYQRGICFWTAEGEKIVNYPKQHMENCTRKHQATRSSFKPNVRVLKNLRTAMVDARYIDDSVAPSYFIEGMLWNVPQIEFGGTYHQTITNALSWLDSCDQSKLTCANGLHWLIRDEAPVCWNSRDYRTFLSIAQDFLSGR